MRVNRLIVAVTIGLLAVSTWPGTAAPLPFQITLENVFPYYQPVSAQVTSGRVIRWKNPTASHHTITHDVCTRGRGCMFNSGAIPPNGTYAIPGLPPGRYPYHCELHPIMQGVVIVKDSAVTPERT